MVKCPIRTISNDNSLFQTVNLSNKYLKYDLLATVLNKCCKNLNLSNSFIQVKLILIKKSQLIKLDLSNCKKRYISYGVVEELLASCQSLKNMSLQGLDVASKIVESMFQNNQSKCLTWIIPTIKNFGTKKLAKSAQKWSYTYVL